MCLNHIPDDPFMERVHGPEMVHYKIDDVRCKQDILFDPGSQTAVQKKLPFKVITCLKSPGNPFVVFCPDGIALTKYFINGFFQGRPSFFMDNRFSEGSHGRFGKNVHTAAKHQNIVFKMKVKSAACGGVF